MQTINSSQLTKAKEKPQAFLSEVFPQTKLLKIITNPPLIHTIAARRVGSNPKRVGIFKGGPLGHSADSSAKQVSVDIILIKRDILVYIYLVI